LWKGNRVRAVTETRNNSRTRTFKLVAGAAIFLLGFVSLWFYVRGASELKIAVKFVGFTNNAAAFVVSNEGRGKVFQRGQYFYEDGGFAGLLSVGGITTPMMLSPGKSNTILVQTLPASEQPWRIVMDFSPDDWRHKLAGKPPWVRSMVQDLVRGSDDTFREKSVLFYSEWLGSSGVVVLTNRVEAPRVIVSPPKDRKTGTNGV
jgi:hypothetical protein